MNEPRPMRSRRSRSRDAVRRRSHPLVLLNHERSKTTTMPKVQLPPPLHRPLCRSVRLPRSQPRLRQYLICQPNSPPSLSFPADDNKQTLSPRPTCLSLRFIPPRIRFLPPTMSLDLTILVLELHPTPPDDMLPNFPLLTILRLHQQTLHFHPLKLLNLAGSTWPSLRLFTSRTSSPSTRPPVFRPRASPARRASCPRLFPISFHEDSSTPLLMMVASSHLTLIPILRPLSPPPTTVPPWLTAMATNTDDCSRTRSPWLGATASRQMVMFVCRTMNCSLRPTKTRLATKFKIRFSISESAPLVDPLRTSWDRLPLGQSFLMTLDRSSLILRPTKTFPTRLLELTLPPMQISSTSILTVRALKRSARSCSPAFSSTRRKTRLRPKRPA